MNNANVDEIKKSATPRNTDKISIVMRTTPVEPINSSRVDHVTFCISDLTSNKKVFIFLIIPNSR